MRFSVCASIDFVRALKIAPLRAKADEWQATIAGGVEGHWLKTTLSEKTAAMKK